MVEICSVKMPRDATQLRSYIATCEDLLPLHDLYKDHCKALDDVTALKMKMGKGIELDIFEDLIDTTLSKKRHCPVIMNR
jgi:hypothetical protein